MEYVQGSERVLIEARIKRILAYRLPEWEELPDQIRSRQFQDFIGKQLGWLLDDEELLTGYMLQNYLKWNILLPLEGRKYSREHVAWIVAITLLKQVLTLDEIKRGITLLKEQMSARGAYEVFCQEFHLSLKLVFGPIMGIVNHVSGESDIRTAIERQLTERYWEFYMRPLHMPTGAACRALVWRLMTSEILYGNCWPYLQQRLLAMSQNSKMSEE